MTPASLFGHVLELLEAIALPGPYPADARVGRFFRARRYLGSKDRKAIGAAVYAWLRHVHRARARWGPWARHEAALGAWPAPQVESTGRDAAAARLGELLALSGEGLLPWSFEETLALVGPRLAALGLEGALPAAPPGEGDWPADPGDREAARWSLPGWLAERLRAERGEAAPALAEALLCSAPVDLRVRTSRISREEAQTVLARELGVAPSLTPLAPAGLRLEARVPLEGTSLHRAGLIEVEDEGSQVIALCLDACAGETILDACAGAGGKSLALAEALAGDGSLSPLSPIIACDVAPRRLGELRRRAARAGIEDAIELVLLPSGDATLPPLPAADLVLVDAPCSGFGTLRRSPDLKHRYGPGDVAAFARAQRALLERFAPAVKPGGRLAYVTCSILREENEDVARAFLLDHPDFEPYPSAWAAQGLRSAGEGVVRAAEGQVALDPASGGTDGLFLALWRRRG